MLYLLYGDTYSINKYIDNILNKEGIEDINISKYDMDTSNYNLILDDASSVSLFDSKKAIIISNAFIFNTTKSIDLDSYEKYFTNPNPNTIMIFTLNTKPDERKKITKLIKKEGVSKEFNTSNNPSVIVNDLLDDYKMDKKVIDEFINLVGNDTYNIQNELDKLKLYKYEDKIITLDDIDNITTKNSEVDLFKLIDSIIKNDKSYAIESYNNMLLYNMEPIQIIIALANKYRLMYQVTRLTKKGYTDGDMASYLKQSPGYIYYLKKDAFNYSEKTLLNEIQELAEMDYNIKSGKIDAKMALELYILKK